MGVGSRCRALALTGDAGLRSRCLHVTGWALAWGGHYGRAAQTMVTLAREHVTADANADAAWNTIGLAATAAYQAGDPDSIRSVADVLAAMPPATAIEPQAARAWALAVTGRSPEAEALLRHIGQTVTGETGLHRAGAAAWLRDRTSDAIRLREAARNASADPAIRAASGGSLAALGWAYLDAGRWDDALRLIAETGSDPAVDITPAAGTLIAATIEAARGNSAHARDLVLAALAADPEHSRVITARARHALGLCALADDDYPTAFEQLRQLLARADCLLADPATPHAYPDDLLSDPAGEQWPFERAQLRLEYGHGYAGNAGSTRPRTF